MRGGPFTRPSRILARGGSTPTGRGSPPPGRGRPPRHRAALGVTSAATCSGRRAGTAAPATAARPPATRTRACCPGGSTWRRFASCGVARGRCGSAAVRSGAFLCLRICRRIAGRAVPRLDGLALVRCALAVPAWGASGRRSPVADRLRSGASDGRPVPSSRADARQLHPLMTLRQVSEFLGIHPKTLQRMAAQHRFPCVRLGKRLRFDRSDVLQWVSERKEGC